jgi:hypothetical protein
MERLTRLFEGMKRLLIGLAVGAFSACAPAQGVVSGAALQVSRGDPARTTIAFDGSTIAVRDSIVQWERFETFEVAGATTLAREGKPVVPQIVRFYRIPETGGVDLKVLASDYDVIEDANPLMKGTASALDGIAEEDAWYPAQVAEMSKPMILRDYRVVTVTLFPVQVNAVTHQARVQRNIEAEVIATSGVSGNEILRHLRPSGAWVPVYRDMIANLDDGALDDATTLPGSMLILTSNLPSVAAWSDSLAEWKTRAGYRTVIDARHSWTSAQAITAIRTAYANWDPPLEYVVLMGDPATVWGIPVDGGTGVGNFDHTYALSDTGDDLEDIAVGRLSGEYAVTLGTINAKIMQYERTPRMTTPAGEVDTMWYHRAFLYASTARGCAGNYLTMRWGQDQLTRHTGMDSVIVQTTFRDYCYVPDVETQINNGVGLYFWLGSLNGGMSGNIADNTRPAGRLPIVVTAEDGAGNYASYAGVESGAEDFLCAGTYANPRGGVAAVGTSTWRTEPGICVAWEAAMIYGIADLQIEHLGVAVAASKAQLRSMYGEQADPQSANTTIAAKYSRIVNLLGDPSLSIWTDVPKVMEATCPETMSDGQAQVTVTVRESSTETPIEGALVCLWKRGPDSVWVRGLTDAQGVVTLPAGDTAGGNAMLTVTKRGYAPFLRNVPCTDTRNSVTVSAVDLDDDNADGTSGNHDHLPNPGETIDLGISLCNHSPYTAVEDVTGVLNSSNPHVAIVNDTAPFLPLEPGGISNSPSLFRINVSPHMADGESALMTLTVTADSQITVSTFQLVCRAPNLDHPIAICHPEFVPGESCSLTVSLENTGTFDLSNVVATLTSFDPLVTVPNSVSNFGTIHSGQRVANGGDPFVIHADLRTFPGHSGSMMVTCTAFGDFMDTLWFTIRVGEAAATDPAGPDPFGYYGYENSDTAYSLHPVFDYVDISTPAGGGVNLNLEDTGVKTDTAAMWAVAQPLPFRFKYYGQVFDTITIGSNGWCALGNQAYMDLFVHAPIPESFAPSAMIAPYYADLSTVGEGRGVWFKSDAANHRSIMQWKVFAWDTVCYPEGATFNQFAAPLDFEVILYDTVFAPTPDGNGRIVMQYNVVSLGHASPNCDGPNGCTIGIVSPSGVMGLPVAYDTLAAPGCAPVENGRAILFTTDTDINLSSLRRLEFATGFVLHSNYPNPFNATTEIRFELAKATRVQLKVYNTLGQLVTELLDENRAAGSHSITWDGSGVASGIYIYQLKAGSFTDSKKMVLIK